MFDNLFSNLFKIDFLAAAIKKPFVTVLHSIHRHQLKAKVLPYTSCFSHADSNALSSVGIHITPDQITKDLNTGFWLQWALDNIKGAGKYRNKMQVLWELQAAYMNNALREHNITNIKAVFSTKKLSSVEIKETINFNKSPVIIDTYPYYKKKNKRLGHVVAAVGYAEEQTIGDVSANIKISKSHMKFIVDKFGKEPRNWTIVDDSFGNMLMAYVNNIPTYDETDQKSGNDTVLPSEWLDNIRGSFSIRFRSNVGTL